MFGDRPAVIRVHETPDRYHRLEFDTHSYDAPDRFDDVNRGEVEIHLTE